MHEISIATCIAQIATELANDARAEKVCSITLRIGALSCISQGALEASFEIVTEGTMLAGAKLKFIHVPLVVLCEVCAKEVEIAGLQCLKCPVCHTLSGDIRRGKELEIESIEILDCVEKR